MIKIKNKEQSIEFINQMGLNCMPQAVLDKTNKGRVKHFFEDNPANEYIIRDIFVKDNFVTLSASTSQNANHRNIYTTPEISLSCELFDDRLWNVPGFEKLIDYINEHNLYEVIVEFAVFKNRVGTQKNNVVIIELRSDY